ncbi:MAG: hypothetical protein HQL08_11305 [Nitrospirae bacterium]|nr:hypothetical protein [Nitrospirota bacterium]
MFRRIQLSVRKDACLIPLLEKTREYADIYILARRRQKGCDGMGELAMVKEEFGASLDGLINYCRSKGYIDSDIQYEIDSVADELAGMLMEDEAGRPG